MQNKVVLVDFSIFMFKAIFSYIKTKEIPPTWTSLNMMFANLKKIGLNKEDIVILALEGKDNWRKKVDSSYKANRKELREKYDFNWDHWFKQYDVIVDKLDNSTGFHIIKIHRLEADDIISYSCRRYKDKECVIVSFDSDFEMLTHFKNVKIFSPNIKMKGAKGGYKIVKNPLSSLEKKTRIERADNLITIASTKEEIDKRRKIVSLIELPEFVDKAVEEELKIVDAIEGDGGKSYNPDNLPFVNSMKKRFLSIYNNSDIITYEDSLNLETKKKIKTKKKGDKRVPMEL